MIFHEIKKKSKEVILLTEKVLQGLAGLELDSNESI